MAKPRQIVSNVHGSFAWSVLHDRHPAIVRQIESADDSCHLLCRLSLDLLHVVLVEGLQEVPHEFEERRITDDPDFGVSLRFEKAFFLTHDKHPIHGWNKAVNAFRTHKPELQLAPFFMLQRDNFWHKDVFGSESLFQVFFVRHVPPHA